MPAHISELGKHNRRTQEQARSHNEHIHVSAKNISEEHHPSKSISLSPIDPMNSTPEKSTVPQVRARKLGANLGDAQRVLSNSPHHTREPNPQLACLPARHSIPALKASIAPTRPCKPTRSSSTSGQLLSSRNCYRKQDNARIESWPSASNVAPAPRRQSRGRLALGFIATRSSPLQSPCHSYRVERTT